MINTKITDMETITKIAQPIADFADKHGVYFCLGVDDANTVYATYQTEGKTSAYCKGMMAEIKQMLKDTFHCKIDVMFYAY
jgi:superfamily II DNA helicase RecQ